MKVVTEMGNRKGKEEVTIVLDGSMSSGAYGSLAKTIQEELQNIGIAVDDDMQAVFDEVGKEAAKKLKKTSPVNPKGKQSGRYAKGWTYEKGKKYRGKAVGVVRNKTDPQLTHILEYGHPLVRNGKVVGNVEAKEHIRPVADWVAEEIENKLTKKIGGN
jgi:hypothetical protein